MNETAQDFSDEQLVNMVLKGNRSAFEIIMIRHSPQISRVISGRVPTDSIEELLHETFIRAFKSLPGYSKKKPLAHWLSVIAVRSCLDYWRAAYKNKEVSMGSLSEDALEWVNNGYNDAPAGSEFHPAAEVLEWAMARLSSKERIVIGLTYLDGYSTREAAELLGWSRSNVKIKTFRARNKLRTILETLLKKGE